MDLAEIVHKILTGQYPVTNKYYTLGLGVTCDIPAINSTILFKPYEDIVMLLAPELVAGKPMINDSLVLSEKDSKSLLYMVAP